MSSFEMEAFAKETAGLTKHVNVGLIGGGPRLTLVGQGPNTE